MGVATSSLPGLRHFYEVRVRAPTYLPTCQPTYLPRTKGKTVKIHDYSSCSDCFGCYQVEVNFMDDVGQTLLNWASAFGTQEMVEFLCAKGT